MGDKLTAVKRGPGRPPTGPESRPETFCVRLSLAEIDALDAAAAKTGKLPRVWARDVLLRAARRKLG